MISKAEVEHVAILARIELAAEEKEEYAQELSGILEFVEKVKGLDTEGVSPVTSVFPLKNVFREDLVGVHLDREKTFSNAPEEEDGHFKVPSIL